MLTKALRCLVACSALASATSAHAGDVTYTFEELPVNTAVTTQYFGVTFSVVPQSCAGSPTLYMRIKVPTGGTSSGTRGLQIDTGCPDFSSDYLRMVFDTAQSDVSFTVGDFAATYLVRAYSTTSGAGLLSTQSIAVGGAGFVGVHTFVSVTSGSTNIRRIEVETSVSGLFETIDDLTFDPDSTPPLAEITAPAADACGCSPVQLRGTANDPDGTYERDTAEYRAAASTTWTTIGTASTPVTNGVLYNWNTAALAEGLYFVRLTVENATGLSSTAVTSVWVSQNFDTVEFSVPLIVGGDVCPDGTVFDNWCGTESYTVGRGVTGSGIYTPVDPGMASYAGSRINEQLAVWDTAGIPDGNYTVRVEGENPCGQSRTTTHNLIVDNTPPVSIITTPVSCVSLGTPASVTVRGTVNDAHLGSWALQYAGGGSPGWTTIAAGNAPVMNNVLGVWNTAVLPRCAYTLRLVVSDQAVVNCNSAIHNVSEHVVSVDVGCEADFDRNGDVAVPDIFAFLSLWFAGCP